MTMLSDEELATALGWLNDAARAVRHETDGPMWSVVQVRAHIDALTAQRDRLQRGGAALGRIVASQNRDALAAIGNPPDLIDEDGDGDWAVVWERLAELRPERDAALAKLDALYSFHKAAIKEAADEVDALTAQRDRARDIAVSLEQELAEVQRLAKTVDGLRNVFGVKS